MPETALFSTAEARAFNGAQLASVTDYPTQAITDKEAEVRAFLEKVCGVNFIPTSHTSEVHDGDGSNYLVLKWPLVTEVTALSVDGVAFTAAELNATDYGAGLAIDAELGLITRRSGLFLPGWSNVSVSYVAGYTTPPAAIKRAALVITCNELPVSNVPWQAEGYDAGGTSYSWSRGDGYGGNWSSFPDVMKAIRMYDRSLAGMA